MPNNAVLTVVGDVEPDDAFRRASEYFAAIAAAEAPRRTLAAPLPPLAVERRLDFAEEVPSPAVWFAGRLPADSPGGRDLAAVTLAVSIAGDGETSRLHRRLVRKEEIALSAGFGINALIAGTSLGLGSVRALPGRDLDDVVALVSDVLEQLAADGPTAIELEVARAQAEREYLDDMGTAAGRADAISASALLFDDPTALNERLPVLRSITADEVREAAERWLLPFVNAQARVTPLVERGVDRAADVEAAVAASERS
jgi:predicted Zn-dependent peptidase